MLQRCSFIALLTCLLALAADDAHAQSGFQPQTENERLLMEMIQNQAREIEALEEEVQDLRDGARPTSKASAAPKPGAPATSSVSTEQRIDAVEERVDELANVMQTRVTTVEARTQDGKATLATPGPRFESQSGDFAVQVVGTIQADAAGYEQGDRGAANPKMHGGTNLRRLHIGLQGTAYRNFSWALVYDPAASSAQAGVRDAVVAYNGLRPFALTLGQQKPNVGLEATFSDRSNAATFLEAGLPNNLVTAFGTRQIGARLSAGGEHYAASFGVFGEDVSNNNVSSPVSEGWGPAGRVAIAPLNKPGLVVHAGASGYWRKVGRSSGVAAPNPGFQLRYRAQPEVTVDSTRLIDTTTIGFGESVGLLGVEGLGIFGPVSVQGEWVSSWVDQEPGRPGLQFDGAYAFASWFLTGESRVYDSRTGIVGRMSPKKNFSISGQGWGAFELAVRWSYLDLNSNPDQWLDAATLGGVRGGSQMDWTLGLNWYLNPYLRLMFNYVHADADNFTVPAAMGPGADEGSDADIFALRVHQEW